MTESFDQIATDLQELRARAGHPSYAEIVATIARHREAKGASSFAARPGRTTVYDAFRVGRRRVDPALVGEIVRALGVDDEGVRRWEERCREARRIIESPGPLKSSVALPAPPADGSPDELVSTVEPVTSAPPDASGDPTEPPGDQPRSPRSALFVGAVMAGCIVVNLLGRALVDLLDMALFLDMTGTAVAAIALGPWLGAVVGLASNLLGTSVSGPDSIPYAAVNVVGALAWGYGARSRRFTRSLPSFVGLNVAVALICTTTAVPITLAMGDAVTHGTSRMAHALTSFGPSLLLALYSTNLLMSLADKLICGLVALTVMEALPGRSLLQRMTQSSKGVPASATASSRTHGDASATSGRWETSPHRRTGP